MTSSQHTTLYSYTGQEEVAWQVTVRAWDLNIEQVSGLDLNQEFSPITNRYKSFNVFCQSRKILYIVNSEMANFNS